MVTVYYFDKYDIKNDKWIRSRRPATLETIAQVEGRPDMSSGVQIDEGELDGNGFRRSES